ncbi:MAG: molecular chaperone HtpG [Desulfobulbaceae bacterium]|nr:molecular chaperone HtpG [Desulfobulbaceae bacterium]
MSQVSTEQSETFEFRAEMKQLLNIIIHSLYTNPEVFLRELVSNSSDALNKVRFMKLTETNIINPESELKINIHVDKDAKSLTIEDTGIGMTHDDMVQHLGTIAKSGTAELISQIKESGKSVDANLIGQFGVGFYSVFMVTDEVVVESRHAAENSVSFRWKSSGEYGFEIEPIEERNRGTKITFKLKEEYHHFADETSIKQLLKKYSNFVDFPIYVNDEEVNKVQALWHKRKDEISTEELNEFYKFISGDYQEPLSHLHLNLEGNINFKALLFIPQMAPANLFRDIADNNIHLYSNKIFIQDDPKDLLPEYLRFIRGVVDTEDLPLNVSREVTQSSPVMAKIKQIITSKMLAHLDEMASKEPEKYDKFFKQFGSLFKSGVNQDYTNKSKIVELLRFESSKTSAGEFTSLNRYVSNMRTEQNEIYYIMGNFRNEVDRNPNMEYFKKHDIEVLYLLDPVDLFTVPYIFEYDGKHLTSIEKADISIPESKSENDTTENDEVKNIITFAKEILGDKVEDIIQSKRLVDSVASLVVGKNSLDPQMEKMMKMMDKEFIPSKRILELNIEHPILKNLSSKLSSEPENEILKLTILQIFDIAMLNDGQSIDVSDFTKRANEMMLHATNRI